MKVRNFKAEKEHNHVTKLVEKMKMDAGISSWPAVIKI